MNGKLGCKLSLGLLICCLTLLIILTACPPQPPASFTVTYDGNGNTGGSVPTDGGGTDYEEDSTFTMGNADVTLFAKWTADGTAASTYTLTVSVDGAESVTKDPDKSSYDDGEEVTLTAVPDSDNSFLRWSGDASGYTSASTTLTMDGDKSVTAEFIFGNASYVRAGASGAGTKAAPWGNIQDAVDNSTEPAAIFVAAGTYETDGTVVAMKEGVSLYGGFTGNFSNRKYETESERNNASYKTLIHNFGSSSGTSGDPLAAVLCDGSSTPITSSTVFEGFTVQGGTGSETAAIFCDMNGSPTIRYNTITGVGSGTSHAYGVYSDFSNPRISRNSITGRTTSGAYNAYGVWIGSASGQMTIDYNDIKGGDGVDRACAIHTISCGSNLIIEHNTLLGGLNTVSSSYGIRDETTPTASIIRYNTINAGSSNLSSGATYGIEARGSTIYNNTVHGGAAWSTYGIYTTDTAVTSITNNTICGGEGHPYAMGVRYGGNDSVIRNNVIFCLGGTDTYGIYESGTTHAAIAKNNDIFDCEYVYSEDGSTNCDTIAAMESEINGETAGNASGNVSLDLIDDGGSYYFEDYDGSDNDIDTMEDNDWRPTSDAPLNVRGGGLDLSGDFTDDMDGATRTTSTPTGMTNDGAAGWSMGAYEED